jgi:hypothetical protein
MEAVAIEMIEESCAKGCADAPDPLQVDRSSGPPPAETEDGGNELESP